MSAPFIRKFAIAGPNGDGRRAYLNEEGAFFGHGVPLLEKDAFGLWRPRPEAVLERLFGLGYGEPVDLGWRMDRLASVARALNQGDLCLAAIALVRAELPELPGPIHAKRMAKADEFCKAGYNANEPRDAHNQKWVAAGGAEAILAEAKKHGGWLSPKDVHRGNEKECVSLVRAVIPGLPHSGAWKEGQKLTQTIVIVGGNSSGYSHRDLSQWTLQQHQTGSCGDLPGAGQTVWGRGDLGFGAMA